MDASTNQNNNKDEIVSTNSQPTPSTATPVSNKRPFPDSPTDLPATQKQQLRQIRRRNYIGDLRDIGQKPAAKTPALRKNVTDKVIEALTSTDVLNKIVPVLTDKITETITSVIEASIQSCVHSHIKPLIETINKQQQKIADQEAKISLQTNKLAEQSDKISKLEHKTTEQGWTIKEQYAEINDLFNKMSGLEIRIESQEQYSRRTSLRFHNIQVPVDERGRIVHPVDTDQLILQICNTQLGLDININDIGRSHVIGKVKNGKSQVIVRFLSYRIRNRVYTNKKALKGHPDNIFITENLTKYRTELVKKLSQLKYSKQIYTYWTSDGRIYVKQNETSRKQTINNFDDIISFERSNQQHTSFQSNDIEEP